MNGFNNGKFLYYSRYKRPKKNKISVNGRSLPVKRGLFYTRSYLIMVRKSSTVIVSILLRNIRWQFEQTGTHLSRVVLVLVGISFFFKVSFTRRSGEASNYLALRNSLLASMHECKMVERHTRQGMGNFANTTSVRWIGESFILKKEEAGTILKMNFRKLNS